MDKLDIINLSLQKVGARRITSLDEVTQVSSLALSSYDFARDEVLRDYAWSFATVYKELALTTTTPAFGYEYAFSLPIDCVVLLDLRNQTSLAIKKDYYVISGTQVYTNYNTAYIRYISNNVKEELYPSDFCAALALKIASEIALLASQNNQTPQMLMQEYEYILERAKANDAKSNNDIELDEFANSKLLQARRGNYNKFGGGTW